MTPVALSPVLAASLAPLRGSALASHGFDVVPVALIVGAAVLYGAGVRRVNRLQPRHPWSGWRTAAWAGGLAVTAVSIFSFVGVYDGELFWVHMVQHLLLLMVAAPLFAMASPLDLLWRATTGVWHERVTSILRGPAARLLGHPATAFILYAVVIPVSHLTSFYNLTLENGQLHNLEHVVFLVIGYLFWRQIFGQDPNRYRLHPALQMFFLFLAVPIDTFVGLSLDSTRRQLFPAYTALHRTWGLSPLLDLHVGGILMWVVGDTLMMLPLIVLALRWLHLEQRRAIRVDRELDASLVDRAPDAVVGHKRYRPRPPVFPTVEPPGRRAEPAPSGPAGSGSPS